MTGMREFIRMFLGQLITRLSVRDDVERALRMLEEDIAVLRSTCASQGLVDRSGRPATGSN